LVDGFDVFRSQGFEDFCQKFSRLFYGIFEIDLFHDGSVEIRIVEFFQTEHFFLQYQVAVKGIQIGPDLFDVIGVKLDRNIVLIQGGCQARIVLPIFCCEVVVLQFCDLDRTIGVFELGVVVPKGLEDFCAIFSFSCAPIFHVIGAVELDGFPR